MIRALWAMIVVVALLLTVGAGGAPAQEPYPSRAITIVAPFPPGGVVDITARPFAATLERVLKQPVVISNKPGAAGAVGRQVVAVAKPDGYIVLVDLVSISMVPEVDLLFGRTPTYTREQLVGIARLSIDPPLLVANAQMPWKSVKDLLDDARKRPGEITYSSSGPYGASHVPMEMLLHAAGGLKMRHLPTTGGGPAMTAVLGGHAHLWASPTAVTAPHIKAGKVRALATFAATRHPGFPDVPTLKELGHDVEYYFWTGFFAPRGIPAGVFKTLREAARKVAEDPEFKSAIDRAQSFVAYQDADEFNAWWEKDAQALAGVIKKIGKIGIK